MESEAIKEWEHILNPGRAKSFFDDINPLPAFLPESRDWQVNNAWWMASFCHLIYAKRRDQYLPAPWQESAVFSEGTLRYAIYYTDEPVEAAVICFRGTTSLPHWFYNLGSVLHPWPLGGMVHNGFRLGAEIAIKSLSKWPTELPENVFVTGHSLGGALANLVAACIPRATLYTFGSPRVGDSDFLKTVEKRAFYRVVNGMDVVARIPHNQPSIDWLDFHHAGDLYHLDGEHLRHTPDLKALATEAWTEDAPILDTMRSFELFSNPPQPIANHSPASYRASLAKHL